MKPKQFINHLDRNPYTMGSREYIQQMTKQLVRQGVTIEAIKVAVGMVRDFKITNNGTI